MPFISVVIPVYNAARFLHECVESLLSQTFLDIEFIFINDGSTDESLEILKQYEMLDGRITLLNQQNSGVSIARNQGIALAKGQYIAFVDADDWVQKELYEKLATIAKSTNPDLLLFNMESFVNGKKLVRHFSYPINYLLDEKFIQENIYQDLIKNDDLFSPCDKLYKKEIIDRSEIIFPPGNSLSEDNLFNLQFFGKISSFYYLDYSGYFYREVAGSATRNIDDGDYFENQRILYHLDYSQFFYSNLSEEKISEFKSFRFLKVVMAIINIYFVQEGAMSLKRRFLYVKKMINSEEVKDAQQLLSGTLKKESSRFEKAILIAMSRQLIFILLLLTKYSQFRNRL